MKFAQRQAVIGNEGNADKKGKRRSNPKIQQQLERITRLPKAQQRFVTQMLDTVIQQAAR